MHVQHKGPAWQVLLLFGRCLDYLVNLATKPDKLMFT